MDTPINVQSQPQTQYITYIGGPLDGQQVPIPAQGLPTFPLPILGGSGLFPGAGPPSTGQKAAEKVVTPVAGAFTSVSDFLNWLTKGDTLKGFGLILLAGLIGTLGIIVFVFAPTPQSTAKTAVKAALL